MCLTHVLKYHTVAHKYVQILHADKQNPFFPECSIHFRIVGEVQCARLSPRRPTSQCLTCWILEDMFWIVVIPHCQLLGCWSVTWKRVFMQTLYCYFWTREAPWCLLSPRIVSGKDPHPLSLSCGHVDGFPLKSVLRIFLFLCTYVSMAERWQWGTIPGLYVLILMDSGHTLPKYDSWENSRSLPPSLAVLPWVRSHDIVECFPLFLEERDIVISKDPGTQRELWPNRPFWVVFHPQHLTIGIYIYI